VSADRTRRGSPTQLSDPYPAPGQLGQPADLGKQLLQSRDSNGRQRVGEHSRNGRTTPYRLVSASHIIASSGTSSLTTRQVTLVVTHPLTSAYAVRGASMGRRRPLYVRGCPVSGPVRSTDGARTSARTAAKKAADGTGGSGYADRPHPDSCPDLPFQEAAAISSA
jgi:hypothetical protein